MNNYEIISDKLSEMDTDIFWQNEQDVQDVIFEDVECDNAINLYWDIVDGVK